MNVNVLETMRSAFYKPIVHFGRTRNDEYSDRYVQLKDSAANDFIAARVQSAVETGTGLLISKWGTIELGTVCAYLNHELNIPFIDIVQGKVNYDRRAASKYLVKNAGFFPEDLSLTRNFSEQALRDFQQIDILGSYISSEKYVARFNQSAIRANLDGYYAPFLWNKPWTSQLKGKKVLVVSPFVDSIATQYAKRELLFDDPNVLPEFKELHLVKAVQSLGGCCEGFNTWFDALVAMENEIDTYEFDIALIGCGAYGMSLGAHVKRQGKLAIHMAGWLQMLFGIYGNRWVRDQPQYAKYINEHWIRPSKAETPAAASQVESGCYW